MMAVLWLYCGMELDYLNYKEPLTEVDDGYGYLGTLGQTKDGAKLQCHICGKLFSNLGSHVFNKHHMKANEYRNKFQLGRRTPLCSDKAAQAYKMRQVIRWSQLSKEEQEKRREQMREVQKSTKRVGQPLSLEVLNKRGMCPEQLIEKIKKCAEAIGKSPSYTEFVSFYDGKYVGAITRTFSSWNGAKAAAKLLPCKSGSATPHNRSHYTDEQLIEYLKLFSREHKRVPKYSDWVRGFLPSYDLYRHRFGGIEKARQIANISN